MEKHLLVTVSEQPSALNGIRFVGRFFSNKEEMKLTLLYIAPRPPAVWEDERTHDRVTQIEQKARQYEAKGRKALEDAKRELVTLGLSQDQVKTKLQMRQFSKVLDIVQEAEKGLYDAVVLGPRGLSRLEEAFDESTSRELLRKRGTFPIWTCRKPDLERKNVLLCVDGSEPALRMADHVGFILAQERTQGVTLFVVVKPGEKVSEGAEKIISVSKEHLLRNGFPAELVTSRVVKQSNVLKAIQGEAEQGKFAVVAAGRTGRGRGFLDRLFVGSVTDALFREVKAAALWTCH